MSRHTARTWQTRAQGETAGASALARVYSQLLYDSGHDWLWYWCVCVCVCVCGLWGVHECLGCYSHDIMITRTDGLVAWTIPGVPEITEQSIQSIFQEFALIKLFFFTLLDRASSPHYINTNIIKFGWELFILWVITYGLSSSEFARFPEFRGTMTN